MRQERLQLGAPGIYWVPPEPIRALTGARMDVCGFAGVAPRGPARPPSFPAVRWGKPPDGRTAHPRSIAVAVESFAEYQRRFGGFEGPGRLPYAVASFFENGGVRAWIARIVPEYDGTQEAGDPFTASGALTRVPTDRERRDGTPEQPLTDDSGTPISLRARSEGSWGNALSASLTFETRPIACGPHGLRALRLIPDVTLPAGALLRVRPQGAAPLLRRVVGITDAWAPDAGEPSRRRLAELDAALPAPLNPNARVEVVEATLDLEDRSGGHERHERLGLHADHPRWLARVLHDDSELAYPTAGWVATQVRLDDPCLPAFRIAAFRGGRDDYPAITPSDFFDARWVPGAEGPGAGVHAFVALPDLASLCVPDLYSPTPLPPREDAGSPGLRCGATFERAVGRPPLVAPPPPTPELAGLTLDPRLDLDAIVAHQRRVVDLAEQLQAFVVLLDVPPGLEQRRILRWREAFSSAYAAAYLPWLLVSRPDDRRDPSVRVNPSAVAAGVIAQRERLLGIPHGPANVVAAGVVDVDERISGARHDQLHPNGLNVFLRDRDGVRLTSARTLARDPAYRQLSVRRLVTMLRRTLDQQMQWAVFEPNGPALRRDLRDALVAWLRELWRANAFAGASEGEAFFVRCDEELNPQWVVDAGQLRCEVGVAPAEPLEFLILRIERGADGTIRVEG